MFKFTIRDLLWLTVVVALAVGWWIEHRSGETARQGRRQLQRQIDQMIVASDEAGFHFSGAFGGGYLLIANDRRADSN